MGSIGGMLNPIGKMPKIHYKSFFMVLLEKRTVYNGILMETIGISLMVTIVCFQEYCTTILRCI